ncbi:hypothetical protein Tco_0592916 [Tanacetum coccineum]
MEESRLFEVSIRRRRLIGEKIICDLQKGSLFTQWRFLLSYYSSLLSPEKKNFFVLGASSVATLANADICLEYNIHSKKFDQAIRHLIAHKSTYVAIPSHKKTISNIVEDFQRLFWGRHSTISNYAPAPESSPSRITSSPSLSPQTHPSTSQQPPTPPFMQTIHDAEEPATMPHDSSQPRVHYLGGDRGVKKLEHKVKASKSRRRTKIDVSNDEEVSEDPSKQGRIIAEIDQNPSISLVQDEGTS